MKVCSKCKKSYSIKFFNKERATKDGLSRWCVSCKAEYKKNYIRSKQGKEKDKIAKLKYMDTDAGKRAYKKAHKKYLKNNKNKHRARCSLNDALSQGKIVRPDKCELCGSSDNLHGHHFNYEKELDVQWVCVPCHTNIHHNFAYEEHF